MDALTVDTFFNGRITVRQPRSGYRYSIDAVILASHVRPRPGDRVLDLGTGCGIIPLIIGFRYPGVHLLGVELQAELADIARANVSANSLDSRVDIWGMDMKDLDRATIKDPVDIVLSNPPYHRILSGRVNPNRQRAVARHEITVKLADVLAAAGRMLKTGGKFVCIYGIDRLVDLFCQMRSLDMEPKFARSIQSRAGDGARLVLVEGVKRGNSGLTVGPPLVIYRDDGTYTHEVKRMFTPEGTVLTSTPIAL